MDKTVACTGFFDGVHKGHVSVFEKLKEESRSSGLSPCVITFWPHPRIVLNKDANNLRLLTTLDEKVSLIKKAGIDRTIVLPFTREFSEMSPEDFISEILVKKIRTAHLCIGYDHRIGKGGAADFDTISRICAKYGITTTGTAAVTVDDEEAGSGKIRRYLSEGNLGQARSMLGYDYFITGIVTHGNKLGRELGFPTANLSIDEPLKLIPAKGVYAAEATVDGKNCPGMLYIGNRPTIDNKPGIEINIFDFSENIYGKKITVDLKKYVRVEFKFGNVNELAEQLNDDKRIVEEYFNSYR